MASFLDCAKKASAKYDDGYIPPYDLAKMVTGSWCSSQLRLWNDELSLHVEKECGIPANEYRSIGFDKLQNSMRDLVASKILEKRENND